MILSRRRFLATTTVGASAFLLRPPFVRAARPRAETYFQWRPIGDHAHVALGAGGNTLLVVGTGGGLLVDCKNVGFGRALRLEAEAIGDPLTHIVNTHHHADHTGGNTAFRGDLPIIAHEAAKPRVLSQLNRYLSGIKEAILNLEKPESPATAPVRSDIKALHDRMTQMKAEEFAPTDLIARDRQFEVGGRPVELMHFGPGHTDNDLVVVLPALNVVHTGDLLFHRRHPFIDRGAGATTSGWTSAVGKIIGLCDEDTVVVPGHGEPTDRAGLQGQIDYFERAREAIGKAIDQGRTRAEVSEVVVPEFEEYGGEQIRPLTFGAIYDELTGAEAK